MSEVSDDLLFHGTAEPFEGDAKSFSHGGILWVAESPSVAQNYIPESGSSVLISLPSYKKSDRFPPNQGMNSALLEQMGFSIQDMDPVYNHFGQAQSFRILPNHPRYGDVVKFIENLGYVFSDDTCWLKCNSEGRVVRADYKIPGTLFILSGKNRLKILDLTQGTNEDDLMDPTYNRFDLFQKAKKAGYDGVRINDFAQSKNWGNLGHRSIGLFDSGVAKLKQERIEARNFDWGDDLRQKNTEEYDSWLKEKHPNWLQRAIDNG